MPSATSRLWPLLREFSDDDGLHLSLLLLRQGLCSLLSLFLLLLSSLLRSRRYVRLRRPLIRSFDVGNNLSSQLFIYSFSWTLQLTTTTTPLHGNYYSANIIS